MMIARQVLRGKYITADVGISGANFAIAETGMISITENEGNARLTCALPKVHIALMGIEKVLPKLEDLALFLPMLATAGAGQALTGYNSLYGGPRQPGESDGPEEFHLVLLDNKRTHLLADAEQRDALHCIRCGACLNVCPIYRNVGGHTYGTTYQGPIGSVITPHLRGLQNWKHLSYASSLCGACTEACPVKIDLHHHLLQSRRNAMAQRPIWWEKFAFKCFAFLMNRPGARRAGKQIWARGTKASSARQRHTPRSSPRLDALARAAIDREANFQGILEVEKAMSERDNIFGRIREALRVPAPVPGAHDHNRGTEPAHVVSEAEAAKHISEWLPAVGDSFDEQGRTVPRERAGPEGGIPPAW